MGLIRKTMSLSTLGLVSFRDKEERTTRYTRQTRNAARAQVAQQAMALEHQRQLITQGEQAAVHQQIQASGQQQMHFQQLQALTRLAPPSHPPVPEALLISPAAPAPQPIPQSPPAGWYPDQQDPQLVRWFDGVRWTGHTQQRT